MHHAICIVQRHDLAEGDAHPELDYAEHHKLLERYRAAQAAQILTPAPRLDAIDWKRKQLASGQFQYTGLALKRVEHIIEQDLEFLRSHPTRRNMGNYS